MLSGSVQHIGLLGRAACRTLSSALASASTASSQAAACGASITPGFTREDASRNGASASDLSYATLRPVARHATPSPKHLPICAHHALPPLTSHRLFHSSSLAAASEPGAAGASGGAPGPSGRQPGPAPVQNPLQAALDAASHAASASGPEPSPSGIQPGSAVSEAVRRAGRPGRRTWMWWDEADEREERRKELALAAGGGREAGAAHLMRVPQSMKKMDRIVKLIRGLPYEDAVAQCKLVPHKAAKYALQGLEHAYEDAEKKGLDLAKLAVDTVFVTKGKYVKNIQPMGKGGHGRLVMRKSHLRIALRESSAPPAFTARRVPSIMAAWQAPRLPLLAAGAAGAVPPPRRRFAYRHEV